MYYTFRHLLRKYIYGSVSAGREFWPFHVIFFQKVERLCGQTVKDRFDFSIDSGQLYLLHSGDLNLALDNKEEEEEGGNNDEEKEEDKTNCEIHPNSEHFIFNR